MNKKNFFIISFLSGVIGSLLFMSVVFFSLNYSGKSNSIDIFDSNTLPVANVSYFEPSAREFSVDFTKAASLSVPAVVHIKTQFMRKSNYDEFFSPFFDFFGQQRLQREYPVTGAGSGVIIRSDGYIITNNHVIQSAEQIFVTLDDKREYEAKLIGSDPNTDLALIKIEANELPFLVFGDSDDLKVGEWVLAVGNPFNLTSTVTAGIVSAKARNINILGSRNSIESFIQTDAVVNRGNSGGALVNTNGELVGINTAIASGTGYFTGYSFAIPSKIARKVAEDIIGFGVVQRAFIGVSAVEVTAQLARELKLDQVKGLYVAQVEPHSGASVAGVQVGDIILSINGKETNSSGRLLEIVAEHRPGDKVNLNVLRKNKERSLTVTLKSIEGTTEIVKNEVSSSMEILGARFQNAKTEDLKKLNLSSGIQIVRLQQGKLQQAGIREGFIITAIDNVSVRTVKDVYTALSNKMGAAVLIEGVYPNGIKSFYGFGL